MWLTKKLNQLLACNDAIEWVKEFDRAEDVYLKCNRGDWMLWYIYKSGIALQDKRKWIGCKVEIARQVQHLMKDERSIKALEIAELYSKGKATEEELKEAAVAAYAAYVDIAYADVPVSDVYTVAAVTIISYNVACSADTAAAVAVVADVRYKSLAKSADIVRKWYTLEELCKQ